MGKETSPQRYQGLDLLRAVAILLVLLLHAKDAARSVPESISRAFDFGWAGVDLFFVLSGFLVGGQVFGEQVKSVAKSMTIFWAKRWFRTFPLYFLVLAVYAIIKPLFGHPFQGWNWGYLFFMQNYTGIRDFDHSWSLCIEEQFYLVFPILAFGFGALKRSTFFWATPAILSLLFRYQAWDAGLFDGASKQTIALNAHFLTHTHLDGLALGMFLAKTKYIWQDWGREAKRICGIVGMGLFFSAWAICYRGFEGFHVVYIFSLLALSFSLILIWAYELKINAQIYRFLYLTSLWSYGMYLWNNLFIRLLHKFSFGPYWPLAMLLFFAGTYFLSFLTFKLVEEKGLALRNKFLKRIK